MDATAFTQEDAAWLSQHQHRKVLDPRVRITGVAARSPADGHPLVLICYPLRTTATQLSETSKKGRKRVVGSSQEDTRGGSRRKWMADQPVPWPNYLWLVDPQLTQRAGRLEHMGWVQDFQNEVCHNTALASELAAAHAQYGAARWAALTDEDRAYCEQEGYVQVLRDTGVGGLRFASQVKCLHAHLAHALSGADNPIGRRVIDALAKGADAKAGKGETDGDERVAEAGTDQAEDAAAEAAAASSTGSGAAVLPHAAAPSITMIGAACAVCTGVVCMLGVLRALRTRRG